MSDVNLRSYSDISYHNGQSKPLTWLANILFPKLEKLVPTLHTVPKSALLPKFPSDTDVASTHLTKLSHLLQGASSGHPDKDTTILFREAQSLPRENNLPVSEQSYHKVT